MAAIDMPLPPVNLRWGGPRYSDDAVYLSSASSSVSLLEAECGLSAQSSVLDIGCGQGRLLTGLLHRYGTKNRYLGIDVHEPSIRWLNETLLPAVPNGAAKWINYRNERYNREGQTQAGLAGLLDGATFDCITLFSVFSHMRLEDIRSYLELIERALAPRGRVFLTIFAEDDVDDEAENPTDYYREWKGALHCVRINRQTFEAIARTTGLQVKTFKYRHTNDGQSAYVLQRADEGFAARVVAG